MRVAVLPDDGETLVAQGESEGPGLTCTARPGALIAGSLKRAMGGPTLLPPANTARLREIEPDRFYLS